jgi:hypothetical protein
MEMEDLQRKYPALSLSGMREQEADRRTGAKDLPSHRSSLAFDHLLRLGRKQAFHC